MKIDYVKMGLVVSILLSFSGLIISALLTQTNFFTAFGVLTGIFAVMLVMYENLKNM